MSFISSLVFLLTILDCVYIAIASLAVVAILVVLCIFFLRKSKTKLKVDEAFIQTLVTALGGKLNITKASNTNGRIQIEVEDLELVNFEEIKKLSTAGVFVTNQTIKMLFSYDSDTICQAILQLKRKEE